MWLILACLVAQATSQDTTIATNAAAAAQTSVISLFLPFGSPNQIEASIIEASPNQTAFALGCASNNTTTTSACYWDPPITITEGESTVIWTNTHRGQKNVTATIPYMTMECAMFGATTTAIPIHGASSAVCTAKSTISHLGLAASTSVLASTEITYLPITVTAGLEKITRAAASSASGYAATATAVSETSTGAAVAGGAPALTSMGVVFVGLGAIVVIGVVL